ncbi:MAG TPA: CCA tRNA nucleotidyltransferase, partial [Hyphomicrobium sp.]|nr:CCA tRNA nucleotidyltransferase [Hyphomicrobium sp.]
HGTITVVADGHSFEVTTLRRDIETDGRHAVVAFTTDWHVDALRRDFTINALSANADGNVFDTVGGIDDLKSRRVRFIGDATSRIREDYLRILRFFRFTSAYAQGQPDAQGLAASVDLKSGMRQLSAERIGAEMMKFIVTPRAGEIARVMQASGIFETLVPLPAHPERLIRMQAIELALGDKPDAIARLAALFVTLPTTAPTLAQNFRFSSADLAALTAAADLNEGHDAGSSERAAKEQIYRSGPTAFGRAIRVAWSRSAGPIPDAPWIEKCRLAATWTPPQMPVSGADVIALGIPAGPRIGRTLRAFEAWWIASEFTTDPALHKAKLAELSAER